MKVEITNPEFKFTFQWLIDLLERILGDIFGFIADEEGWVEEEVDG